MLITGAENNIEAEEFIDEEHASPLLHQIENDYLKSKHLDDHPLDSQPSSLFGEVHLSEINKLKENLDLSEKEKSQLVIKLKELQHQIDSSKSEYSISQVKWKKVIGLIKNLIEGYINNNKEIIEDNKLVKEIEEFEETKEFMDLFKKFVNNSTLGTLNTELNNLMNQLNESNDKREKLEGDTKVLNSIAEEVQSLLVNTEEELINLSELLSAVYYQVCNVNGETPNQIMLDHTLSTVKDNEKTSINLKLEKLKNQLSEAGSQLYLQKWKTISNDSDSKDLIDILKSQIKHLKSVIDSKTGSRQTDETVSSQENKLISASPSIQSISELTPDEIKAIIEENQNSKAIIATKREQISTLRMVIKANKQTAEVALANLKSRYEKEKQLGTETNLKMKTELKALKQDAATFASLRSMFAAKCEEYAAANDETVKKLQACEEEKKTLNQLLKVAIQQKLALTQVLEEYEVDKERLLNSTSNNPIGNQGQKPNQSRNPNIRRLNNNNPMNNGFIGRNLGRTSTPTTNNHSTPKNLAGQSPAKRNF